MAVGPAALVALLAVAGGAASGGEPWVPREPGTAAGCWHDGLTFKKCCTGRGVACWGSDAYWMHNLCCLAFVEAVLSEPHDNPGLQWAPSHSAWEAGPDADPALLACMQESQNGTPYERAFWSTNPSDSLNFSGLCRNDFSRAAGCVAGLPGVHVVMDLFLGMSCTVASMAYALGRPKPPGGRARALEVFTFEKSREPVEDALSDDGMLGMGLRRGWWRVVLADTGSPMFRFQWSANLTSAGHFGSGRPPAASSVTIRLTHGMPYPLVALGDTYRWNALDILCQHRAPLDVVLVDVATSVETEWAAIEFVCRPRWVLVVNLNIPGGQGWIYERLRLLGYWRVELQGHFILTAERWPHAREIRRMRSWVIMSRQTTSGW